MRVKVEVVVQADGGCIKEVLYRKVEHKVKRPSTEKSTASDCSGGFGWVVVADRIVQWR